MSVRPEAAKFAARFGELQALLSDSRHQHHVRVPTGGGDTLPTREARSFERLLQFREGLEMQSFLRLVVPGARGDAFPKIHPAMRRAFRSRALAQDQTSARAQRA